MDIKTKQLQTLIDQEDYDGARRLIEETLQKPLSASEEGMYYAELMRTYIRYMTETNNELTAILEAAKKLMREIDRREEEGLKERSANNDAQQ